MDATSNEHLDVVVLWFAVDCPKLLTVATVIEAKAADRNTKLCT
jgi:hypothetical protein